MNSIVFRTHNSFFAVLRPQTAISYSRLNYSWTPSATPEAHNAPCRDTTDPATFLQVFSVSRQQINGTRFGLLQTHGARIYIKLNSK